MRDLTLKAASFRKEMIISIKNDAFDSLVIYAVGIV